jgi:hypothetical protein
MTHWATVDTLRAIAAETTSFRRDGYSADWLKSGWDAVRHPGSPGVRWRLRRGHSHALIVPSPSNPGTWIVSTTQNATRRQFWRLRSAMEAAMADVATGGGEAAPAPDA